MSMIDVVGGSDDDNQRYIDGYKNRWMMDDDFQFWGRRREGQK